MVNELTAQAVASPITFLGTTRQKTTVFAGNGGETFIVVVVTLPTKVKLDSDSPINTS